MQQTGMNLSEPVEQSENWKPGWFEIDIPNGMSPL